jgi:MFS family permease
LSSAQIGSKERNLVLAAMGVALATVVSSVTSLNIALPHIARDLSAMQTQLQWIVDAYSVVFAGLLLFAGAVGDRVGRRPMLLGGLAVFSAAAAAGAVVHDPPALIVVRADMGIGATRRARSAARLASPCSVAPSQAATATASQAPPHTYPLPSPITPRPQWLPPSRSPNTSDRKAPSSQPAHKPRSSTASDWRC